MSQSQKKRMISVLCILACMLVFIAVLAGSIVLFLRIDSGTQDEAVSNLEQTGGTKIVYTKDEVDQLLEEKAKEAEEAILSRLAEGLNSDATTVEVLRDLYEGRIVVASNGQYHFIPISDTLKKHPYKQENLQINGDGELVYTENGQITSYKGIDVSRYNGEIDWSKVAADGVDFAFIRVGIRGYGAEGRLVEDVGFEENIEAALASGIKVGVYFFSQAITVEEAIEEAEFVKQIIAPYKIQCPVVFDVERVSDSEGRMNKISVEDRTRIAVTFCEEIEKAGYKPMLYYNMEMGATMLDLDLLEEYDKWFAFYNKHFYYPYDFKVWQYTDKGRVDGIDTDVDLNIAFEPLWEE